MAQRISGDPNAFWNNEAVGAGVASAGKELPRSLENFALFITTSGATTITLEAAHQGELTSEGMLPDSPDSAWGNFFYLGDQVSIVFAGAGSRVVQVPNFVPRHVRLRTTNAVTLTAGWAGISSS